MENAVDALKIAFAIIIFALAIALTFSVISNIRHTSDVLFEMSDPNKYYIDDLEGYTYITNNKDVNGNVIINRSVGAETIIPTIYRYYKENFGVTIFTKDENNYRPIARYDLDTENIAHNVSENEEHLKHLNNYINPNKLKNISSEDVWDNNIIKDIYSITENTINKVATPWLTGGKEDDKLKRINADLYTENTSTVDFGSVKYKGKGLFNYINDNSHKFTEYFVFVPQLKNDGTKDLDKTDKLEIIYVEE